MVNERIILKTSDNKKMSDLIDRMVNEEVVSILGLNYKIVSVGVGIEPNNKTENWNSRVFELEGVEE